MAKHENYIKYGIYALIGYIAYKEVWPKVSSEISSLTSSVGNSVSSLVNGSDIWSDVATVSNPDGIPSSSLPVTVASTATNVSNGNTNTIAGLSLYYITSIDQANMLTIVSTYSTSGSPTVPSSLTFSQWTSAYQTAKGVSLPLTASDVGVGDSTQLTINQFIIAVNAKFPSPSLSGIARLGSLKNNSWFGV